MIYARLPEKARRAKAAEKAQTPPIMPRSNNQATAPAHAAAPSASVTNGFISARSCSMKWI